MRFARSRFEVEWSPDKGTLLDLAESVGLKPAFSCRMGICGTCATRITCGSANYAREPTATREDDEVLICSATPQPASREETCGDKIGVVLDL